MRRQIGIFIALAFLATTIAVFGQERSGRHYPAIPTDGLGSHLIVWSQMQKPEPVMQSKLQEESVVRQNDQLSISPTTSAYQTKLDRLNKEDENSFVPNTTSGAGRFEDARSKR